MWTFGLGGPAPQEIPSLDSIVAYESSRSKRKRGKQDNHTPTRLPSMDPFVEFRGMDKLETLFNAALGQQHESEVLEKPRRKHMKKSQSLPLGDGSYRVARIHSQDRIAQRVFWDKVCTHFSKNFHGIEDIWNPKVWPTLNVLDLQFTTAKCDGVLKEIIPVLRNYLEVIKLGPQCKVTNSDLKLISGLLNLTHLKIVGCSLRKAKTGLRSIFSLKNVTRMEIVRCDGVDDSVLENMSKMIHVDHLTLSNLDQITDQGLSYLSKWRLRVLKLENCQSVTSEALNALREAISFLQKITLSQIPWLSNETVLRLSKIIPSLKALDLRGSRNITHEFIPSLSAMSQLTSLVLIHCPRIHDKAVMTLFQLGIPFQCLRLSYVSITDDAVGMLTQMPSLEILDISGNDISDRGLQQVTRNVNIRELYLSDCNDITDKGIQSLRSFVNLTGLSVDGCQYVTQKSLKTLGLQRVSYQRCPNVKMM